MAKMATIFQVNAKMNSDDSETIKDKEDSEWVNRQREIVSYYLEKQRCEHNGVSLEPRWFLRPYIAVWAVRSKRNPDQVGWWAISGDLPTDYITASNEKSTGDVLISFAQEWRPLAENMAKGESLPDYHIGDSSEASSLAPLLLKRAEFLRHLGEDMNRDQATAWE
jgi:Domain of unknown function (DUF4826)